MALCIFCSFLLLSLAFLGMGMKEAGIDHLSSSILDAWRYRVFAKLAEREGFGGVQFRERD